MRSLLLSVLSLAFLLCSPKADAQALIINSPGAELYAARDYQRARLKLLDEAAAGDAIAQHILGEIYLRGRGVAPDNAQAAYWYRKSADQGFVPALSGLAGAMSGTAMEAGTYDDDSYEPILKLVRQAAEHGYSPSQFALATTLEEVEPQEARFWLEQAAGSGFAEAQHLLGQRLFRGRGGPKDEQAAASWMRRAADQGHGEAQAGLGVLYIGGMGVPEDPVEAYKWCSLAAAKGVANAIGCRDLAASYFVSPYQLALAQRLSAEWAPTPNTPPEFPYMVEWRERERASRRPDRSGGVDPDTYRTGSAFFVAPGTLLTNAHVVDGCSAISIAGGPSLSLRAADPTADLALLNVPGAASHSVLYIRQGRGIRLGDDVVVAGFPLSGLLASSLNVTTGTISSLAGLGDDRTRIQITAPVQPGNSGGPLLDSSGNVVGVVVSKLDALSVAGATGDIPQNVNFAISLGTLQAFLDANNIDYQTRNSSAAKSNADVAEIARAATVQVECKM